MRATADLEVAHCTADRVEQAITPPHLIGTRRRKAASAACGAGLAGPTSVPCRPIRAAQAIVQPCPSPSTCCLACFRLSGVVCLGVSECHLIWQFKISGAFHDVPPARPLDETRSEGRVTPAIAVQVHSRVREMREGNGVGFQSRASSPGECCGSESFMRTIYPCK